MINHVQTRRLMTMAFLVMVAFVCLGYRLVEIQVLDHEKFREESDRITRCTFLRAPKRGDIRDIRGNLLAGSVFVKTVCANPDFINGHAPLVARALAPLLQMNEAELLEKLSRRFGTNEQGGLRTNFNVVLKRKVPMETFEKIQAVMKGLPLEGAATNRVQRGRREALRNSGIFAEQVDDQIRVYPNGSLAAHVLGSAGPVESNSPKGAFTELQGTAGVELSLNKVLRGVVGWRNTEFARGRELVAFREQEVQAHGGRNVILTLDSGVQHIVETELAQAMEKHTPISASALVVRPRTGEILAMANLPTYDPNNLTGTTPDMWRNRIITDLAEPGSTFKIVVVSGALNDNIVTLEDKFDCENGRFIYAGRPLSDHEPYGILSVEQIITHSSNIGAAKVGLRLGADRLYAYIRAFGFGAPTGIPLDGERTGIAAPVNKWTKLSITRIPMGHEVAVTPLQMVMAMCAVANEGRLMRPMLVDHIEDEDGNVLFRNYPQQVRQTISPRAARLMVDALKTVVTTNGTGKRAVLEHYTVAGKTGTAQKVIDGVYRRDHHFSSFIGFFPADNPELCVAVFLDDPKHGYYAGEAAAPVFHDIAERTAQYLAIKSDLPPPEVPTPTPPASFTTGAPVKTPALAVNRF